MPRPSDARALHNKAIALLRAVDPDFLDLNITVPCISRLFDQRLNDEGYPPFSVYIALGALIAFMWKDATHTIADIPNLPSDEIIGTIHGARWMDQMHERIDLLENFEDFSEEVAAAILEILTIYTAAIPASLRTKTHAALHDADDATRRCATVPMVHFLNDVGSIVHRMVLPFYGETFIRRGTFQNIRYLLDRNLLDVSGLAYSPQNLASPKLVQATRYKGEHSDIPTLYLKDTPLLTPFVAPVPIVISEKTRFEHHWIVAGSGHGKTQTLQHLIAQDLDKVASGEATVIVIDSQGDMIRTLSHLKAFAPGQAMADRLVLIDPTDIDYPLALNLFDVNMERLNRYSPVEREQTINAIIELYDFVLASLLTAELTAKMSNVFRFLVRLLFTVPGANIRTLLELMQPNAIKAYAPYVAQLGETARQFFETEFNDPAQYKDTKKQVTWRLYGLLQNQTFERMFAHPRNKLNLFAEMNAGKVILINTAKSLLKTEGSTIFGRFFIAMIAQAAQERAALRGTRLPVYVYIDEAQEYFDKNIVQILEQARKFNVGLILAHQYLGQLAPQVRDALSANTAIKFAGGLSESDARLRGHDAHQARRHRRPGQGLVRRHHP
jgi:hypothetical protein